MSAEQAGDGTDGQAGAHGYERLSTTDITFLYGETENAPTHFGGMAVVDAAPFGAADGTVDVEGFIAMLDGRVRFAPKFLRKLATVPFELGRPVWVDDEEFDLRSHVHHVVLPEPGDRRALLDVFAEQMTKPVDRSRPMWDMWLIEGLADDDELALIWKIHHVMMDGLAAVELSMLMFDFAGEAVGAPAQRWQPEPAPSGTRLLLETVEDNARHGVRTALGALRGIVTHPRIALGNVTTAVGAGRQLLQRRAEPLPFSKPVGPRRRFDSVVVDMEDVLRAKRAHDATVNDIVLAAITAAMRELLHDSGVTPDDAELSAMIAVSTRGGSEPGDTGNRLAMLVVDLPVDAADPRSRLQRVCKEMASLKGSTFAEGLESLYTIYDFLPQPLLRASSRFGMRMRSHHLLVSNVRGPDFPLYIHGARCREVYPYFGVADFKPIVIVAFSYDTRMHFGIVTDPDLVHDPTVLTDTIPRAISALA